MSEQETEGGERGRGRPLDLTTHRDIGMGGGSKGCGYLRPVPVSTLPSLACRPLPFLWARRSKGRPRLDV